MRSIPLDFLRGIAVLLVLLHHAPSENFLSEHGWMGVDLFFVLSGFLVSGLLFKEFIKTGRVSVRTFIARRGLKIYPAFYFFLAVTILTKSLFLFFQKGDHLFTLENILSELFFLQNYSTGLWVHTWSLAVEEHFYLLLIIIFWLLAKFGHLSRLQSFRISVVIILVLCLFFRIAVNSTKPFSLETHYFPTHLRVDSLFFGVLLSHFYHFSKASMQEFLDKYCPFVLIFSFLLIGSIFLLPRSSGYTNTFGYSALYIGFGCIILLGLSIDNVIRSSRVLNLVIKPISQIGFYSYSIYLWHLFVAHFILSFVQNSLVGYQIAPLPKITLYLCGSILMGVIFFFFIEKPVLKFRDRFYPSSAIKN